MKKEPDNDREAWQALRCEQGCRIAEKVHAVGHCFAVAYDVPERG